MSDEQPGTDRRRIEALETVVRSLLADLERLRGEVSLLRSTARPPSIAPEPPIPAPAPASTQTPVPSPEPIWAPSPAPAPRAQPAATSSDLEQIVGRYGTLVVATLSILIGLGVFLQWAVARGLLGPEVRVALGAVAAVVLAGVGLWMRTHRSALFGNALLVIALAIVHVVAWAAGPELAIVPPGLALGVAAAASLAFAALALRDDEEFLFCLGLGGALLAPFVTSTADGTVGQLLVFGGAVLAAAILALRDPAWRFARLVLPLFAGWYMAAGVFGRTSQMSPGSRFWPAAFALGLALTALTLGARGVRRGLVRSLLTLLALAILAGAAGVNTPPWPSVAYALFGALTVHALRRRSAVTEGEAPDTWYEVVGLPLLFLGCAVLIRDRFETPEGAAIAAAWAALTLVFMALDGASHRARHLAVVLTAVMIGSGALLHHDDLARMVAFAVVAVAAILTLTRVRGAALLLPIGLSLALGTLVAVREYERRESWTYMPFLNEVALAAMTVVVAYGVLSWLVPRALAAAVKDGAIRLSEEPLAAMRLLGPVAAFLWVRQELVGAFSSDIATFLLITFYAVCGVGTILLGRARSVSALRQVGLVLSLYAAVKVVSEASGVDRIGLRVGSYLVVGGFLLGVGYLYRTALPPVDSES